MTNTKQSPIFVLHPPDEMRHPYENALTAVGKQLQWFGDLASLLGAAQKTPPQIVVIDLDLLKKPFEETLSQLRVTFANSDLVALSSSDSATLALQCIRSGFTDFLLKPTSPEELAWSIRKCQQRHELFRKLEDPRTNLVRAVTQISSCTTPMIVRLCTLEYLQATLKCDGAAWVNLNTENGNGTVYCTIPKDNSPQNVLSKLPAKRLWKNEMPPVLTKNKNSKQRKLFVRCQNGSEGIFFWGIPKKPSYASVLAVRTLLEHSELSLLNIQKFDEIKQQTFVDDVTGLYNSRYLKFALANSVTKCKRPVDCFSVLFIDVDHFKSVNDSHGHLVGSEFLVTIGRTVKNSVRNIDPVFRYGGDEFVVILNDTPTAGAKEIAERIRKHIERRVFVIKGQRLQTTVSIGIATYPDHAADHEALLKLADEAMYNAKKTTRNAVSLAVGIQKPQKLKEAI